MSIYNYLVRKPDGEILSMESYIGKTILIVNSASQCAFTYQYEDLQKLYTKYQANDFVVLVFPCDQFANQNPEDGMQTATQCKTQFGTTYTIFDKIEVNGEKTHPLFNYLKHEVECAPVITDTLQQKMRYNFLQESNPSFLLGRNIRWNFTKFLVDPSGKVVQRFEPEEGIDEIEESIKQYL